MSNVNIQTNIDVDIELTQEEKDNLIQTCKILTQISKELWEYDADETEIYSRIYWVKEGLRDFLRRDVGIEINNRGEVADVQQR